MNLKKSSLALAALLAVGAAQAQQAQQGQTAQTPAPPAAEPTSPFSFNVGVVSDYRFRGMSQSQKRPALQGGIDFAHSSGFYVGTWLSTIRFIDKLGGDGKVEWDIYGGYKGKIGDAVAFDVGALRYQYPNQDLPGTLNFNTTELYGALTFGPATVKYSRTVSDKTFGCPDSTGSYYIEAAATFDTGIWGLTVTPHVGHQHFRNSSVNCAGANYTDWSIGLGKDFGNGWSMSLTYVDTNTNKGLSRAYYTVDNRYLGKATGVLGVKYSF